MYPLNLFYEEPDHDRWIPLDRFPRRVIRRLIRGGRRVGGQKIVFVNLCHGLDRLNVSYRINSYRRARTHPDELACIIGKSHLLTERKWRNPVVFGASVFSHPVEHLNLAEDNPTLRKILVPGLWMAKMWEPYFPGMVAVWPVGIDTHRWKPSGATLKTYDFLVYDKVRWKHDEYERTLLAPMRNELAKRCLTTQEIRYGFYEEEKFQDLLQHCRAMIFLCEHETQGIAYQQALACGVPVLTWDRGGFWQDPFFYPDKVQFEPVTSVPYWDDRCGRKFNDMNDFEPALDKFVDLLNRGAFAPRDYVLENLTLEKCAQHYLDICRTAFNET